MDSELQEALAFVQGKWGRAPRVGIILGTGSGGVANRLQVEQALDYSQIPGFVRSTATGHRGQVICGTFGGLPTIAMQGRFHRYEGWTFDQTVFPTRLMAALGIQGLVVTNAAGGVDPRMKQGDLIFLDSHIDLLTYWPGDQRDCHARRESRENSRGDEARERGHLVRGDQAYCSKWREMAQRHANRLGVSARSGVYVALHGPNYETRAEYRLIRKLGGDVVGMSTVAEVAVASLRRIPVLAISVVTNVARPDALEKTSGEEVVHAARDVEADLATIIEQSAREYFAD
ncbi:MAG: purine-nucleoside phosphorylase [Planctomycetaceae bacterium]|nr:purine-nucleoside phosphorylase [Planctomycetaceae bacterium]